MNLLVSLNLLFFSVFTRSIRLHYFPVIFSSPDTLVSGIPMLSHWVHCRFLLGVVSHLPSLCVPQSPVGMVLFSTWIQHTANATTFSVKAIFMFMTFQTSLVTPKVSAVPVNCPTEANSALGQHWLVPSVWQSCRFITWT